MTFEGQVAALATRAGQEAKTLRAELAPKLRVVALADATPVTMNCDTTDLGILTSLSQNTTINNPTGTPVNGQALQLRIKSAAARTLTWGNQFRWSADLPVVGATSGGGLTDYFGMRWNSADSKWDVLANVRGY